MEKSDEKVDEGFELVYWKLSYRRKFIRTLWMLPLLVLVIFLHFYFPSGYLGSSVTCAIIVVGYMVQLLYTFYKWKKCQRDGKSE